MQWNGEDEESCVMSWRGHSSYPRKHVLCSYLSPVCSNVDIPGDMLFAWGVTGGKRDKMLKQEVYWGWLVTKKLESEQKSNSYRSPVSSTKDTPTIKTLSWGVGCKDVCPASMSINSWLDIDSSELCIETGSSVCLRPEQPLNLEARVVYWAVYKWNICNGLGWNPCGVCYLK